MEYILFIHNNNDKPTSSDQWNHFFTEASKSGLFLGGSEIANQIQVGEKRVDNITNTVAGFMRFEADNKEAILELLKIHPVSLQGGTLELCEMPKSDD
ncbi:MAG: hypothetical protein MK212_21585 [Saprospiraceae bacterium]|nr:hypothetical protein [Saprospiraceae bacterium]